MNTDRELLQQAALAYGGFLVWHTSKQLGTTKYFLRHGGTQTPWNPLEHDADAFRLAVRCLPFRELTYTREDYEYCGECGLAATRRAIVIAAAELGAAIVIAAAELRALE